MNGNFIKTTRERLGLRLADLGARAGVHEQTIYRVEHGYVASSIVMAAIRAALQTAIVERVEQLQGAARSLAA